jgi:hypothetical protein
MSKTSRPTKAEQETILLTSEADKLVSIYTFNRRLIRRLEAYSHKYPHLCQLKQTHTNGAATYEIVKSRISLRFLSPTSEERKAQLREQLEIQETRRMMMKAPAYYGEDDLE